MSRVQEPLREAAESSGSPLATLPVLALRCDPSAEVEGRELRDSTPTEDAVHLGEAFDRVAARERARPALVTAAGTYSYAALRAAAHAVRDRIRSDARFRPADRVAILLPNGPEYVAAFYGTLLAGGVAVPIPPDIEEERLRRTFDIARPGLVLTGEAAVRRRGDLFAAFERLAIGPGIGPRSQPAFEPETAGGDAPAAIFFTSGSTGAPKGVTLSHSNLISNARSIREYLGVTGDDRALGLLPFYHAFGNSVLQSHLLAGAAVVVAGSFAFPQSILDAVLEHRLTSVSGVPDVFRMLLDRSSLGAVDLPSLRYLAVAGGRLDPDQAVVLAARAAPAELFVMYGQTEATARLSYLPPDQIEARFGSIGRAVPGVTLQVVDEAGRPVAPGEVGEVRARGPNVMLGYWRDEEATAAAVRDGWLYTGDLATVDADGFVYPRGRRGDLAKVAGYRVHPSELEEFVRRHADVLEAVAVPYEAPGLGTRFALFVQPWGHDRGLTAEAIRTLCARHLPRHKVPEHVEVLDRLPLNDAHKTDRFSLRRRAETAPAEIS